MSQVHVPSSSIQDSLILQMIANGGNTASGSFYDFELSDDSLFDTTLSSGSNITLSPSDNTVLLKKGLYQLNLSAAIRTGASSIYGLSQTTLQITTDPTFNQINVVNDQANQWYGNGTDVNTPVFFDMNNAVLINVTVDDTPVAFRMRNTNEESADFFIAGSDTFPITIIQFVRLGDAQ